MRREELRQERLAESGTSSSLSGSSEADGVAATTGEPLALSETEQLELVTSTAPAFLQRDIYPEVTFENPCNNLHPRFDPAPLIQLQVAVPREGAGEGDAAQAPAAGANLN